MTEVQIKNRNVNMEKLQIFGFKIAGNAYIYHTDLVNGQLKLTVKIDSKEKIYTEVIDSNNGDEYVLHIASGASGSFVGQVKHEYETVLNKIFEKCFDFEVFRSQQAKEVISYIRNTYGDELEYLWKGFPDNAVARRKDSQKWYAVLLTASRRKLGFDSDERVEILDLRMTPEDIKKQVDNVRILPGYHMNKNHWITVCLNGSVALKEIQKAIDSSFNLAIK